MAEDEEVKAIYQSVVDYGPMSAAGIAEIHGCDRYAVDIVVELLAEAGLIQQAGVSPSGDPLYGVVRLPGTEPARTP